MVPSREVLLPTLVNYFGMRRSDLLSTLPPTHVSLTSSYEIYFTYVETDNTNAQAVTTSAEDMGTASILGGQMNIVFRLRWNFIRLMGCAFRGEGEVN
jgi:hypothetical protein